MLSLHRSYHHEGGRTFFRAKLSGEERAAVMEAAGEGRRAGAEGRDPEGLRARADLVPLPRGDAALA